MASWSTGKIWSDYDDCRMKAYDERENRLYQPLEVGDTVRLKNGTASLDIKEIWYDTMRYKWMVSAEYKSGVAKIKSRRAKDFVLIENYEGEEDMTKLYEVTAGFGKTYATKLAVDSEGNWVMEPKGGGTVFSANPKDIEEVLPYTISVVFKDGGQVYSYLAEKGKYEEGAFYMMNNRDNNFTIVQVTKVDTKSRTATKDFKPFGKLSVEKIS